MYIYTLLDGQCIRKLIIIQVFFIQYVHVNSNRQVDLYSYSLIPSSSHIALYSIDFAMYQLPVPLRAHMSFAHSTSWTRKQIAFQVYRLIVFDVFQFFLLRNRFLHQSGSYHNINLIGLTCSFFIYDRCANLNPHAYSHISSSNYSYTRTKQYYFLLFFPHLSWFYSMVRFYLQIQYNKLSLVGI